jgi:mxaC protein
MTFDYPWLLLLLPLAAVPLMRAPWAPVRYSWIELVPPDRLSDFLGWLWRLLGAAAIAATVAGLAGPNQPQGQLERVGQGAEVLLLLDRSSSMDQPFGVDLTAPAFAGATREAKGTVARRVLSEFTARRGEDLFAMMMFSTFPIPTLRFTQRQEMIQAGIAAADLGRGLADTDIGRALLAAAAQFDNRPYSGSRVVLLVSDGGAQLDPQTRARIVNALERQRIALYWIYIRSFRSPGLSADAQASAVDDETVPERSLHAFFRSMGTPYRAYEAENPDALQRAIADVSRLENLPIRYTETLPREDLGQYCYGLALAATMGLMALSIIRVQRWV